MPIATPEVYADMFDRAKSGSFAYPAINITSSQTVTAAIQGFAEAGSDGIIQVSTGGAEYASGATVKDRVAGSLALAAYAAEVAKGYPITVALHTDHCAKQNLDSWVRPLLALEIEQVKAGKLPTFQSHMWDGSSVPLDENLKIAADLLEQGVSGMSPADMREYLQHVADRRLTQLGIEPMYGSRNPFAFMELQDVQELSNFFERKVSAYQVGVSGSVGFDEDF